jgi:hypothetical protein
VDHQSTKIFPGWFRGVWYGSSGKIYRKEDDEMPTASIKRRYFSVIVLLTIVGLLVGVGWGLRAGLAATLAGPTLTIPDQIPPHPIVS